MIVCIHVREKNSVWRGVEPAKIKKTSTNLLYAENSEKSMFFSEKIILIRFHVFLLTMFSSVQVAIFNFGIGVLYGISNTL